MKILVGLLHLVLRDRENWVMQLFGLFLKSENHNNLFKNNTDLNIVP